MALGMDGEEILDDLLQHRSPTSATGDGWRMPFNAGALQRPARPITDLIDADTGEVVVEAGKKITAAPGQAARREGPEGAARDRRGPASAATSPRTSSTTQTGEIYPEAGDEIDREDSARR